MTDERFSPVTIGISSCLLGEQVRYDGGHKRDRFVTGELVRYMHFVPLCPEVGSGMTTPRPPHPAGGRTGQSPCGGGQ